jgi:hypothetical protein
MINENTLRILNEIAFGADIDSLESYLIDYKQANLVTDMSRYEYNHKILVKKFNELTTDSSDFNSSPAFSDSTSLEELETDRYDKFFTEHSNYRKQIVYGSTDEAKLEDFKNVIDEHEESVVDIIGILNITGVNIKCTYINGRLYKVNLIGTTEKYTDITERVKSLLIEYIEEFKDYKLVELRGKISIFNTDEKLQKYSLNIECSVIRNLRNNINIEKLHIVFNDIFIECEELPYNNQWEKLEYLRDIGISVPHHGLLRNIDSNILGQALKDLDDYFYAIKETEGIIYDFNGFIVKTNDDIEDNNEISFVYTSTDVAYRQNFQSTVKSISSINCDDIKQVLNIVRVQCNDKVSIDKIELDDVYDLEQKDIKLGGKVVFNVVNGKAKLV